ncbi:MAG: hypothetical protein EOM25_12715 [Deltaproteobacteria bacterium]|nr:hypothetical protein [Deltaproteobacteria bacterium]
MNAERVERLRKRQLRLALGMGLPYLGLVAGMFVFFYIGGRNFGPVEELPLRYWLSAVVVYPVGWGLYAWFARRSAALERNLEGDDR